MFSSAEKCPLPEHLVPERSPREGGSILFTGTGPDPDGDSTRRSGAGDSLEVTGPDPGGSDRLLGEGDFLLPALKAGVEAGLGVPLLH